MELRFKTLEWQCVEIPALTMTCRCFQIENNSVLHQQSQAHLPSIFFKYLRKIIIDHLWTIVSYLYLLRSLTV